MQICKYANMQRSWPFFKPSIAKLDLKFIMLDSSLVEEEERDEQLQ